LTSHPFFLSKGLSTLNQPLLTPAPPRLVRIKTGMKMKALWREVTSLCCLLSLSLKLKVLKRNGRAWKI
jgi:hypothetical protein